MREIEYTAYQINRVPLGGEYGGKEISAPRIDMTWGFKGYRVAKDKPPPDHDVRAEEPERGHYGHADDPDWRADEPWRRSPQDIYSALRARFWWANVALPHAVAVGLGAVLFIAAALNAPGLEQLRL
jgi:hypothetical protein